MDVLPRSETAWRALVYLVGTLFGIALLASAAGVGIRTDAAVYLALFVVFVGYSIQYYRKAGEES